MSLTKQQKWARVLYWLVFTVLAVRLLHFIDHYAVDLFFYDQWGYLTTSIFPHDFISGFFTRLGPHRIGLGYPFFKSVLELSDYNNRALAFMVGGFAITNALLFTWLKLKRIGPLRITDICIPLIFLNLNQDGTFFSNPNITIHQLVFFLLLLLVIIFSNKMSPAKFIFTICLTPLITFTGNGFFVVAALVGFSILMIIKDKEHTRRWWFGISASGLISIGAYLLTANYSAMSCAGEGPENFIYYLKFFKGMLLNGLVINYEDTLISWVLFIALLVLGTRIIYKHLIKQRSPGEIAPLLIIGYVLLFIVATTTGRWCFTLIITESSRYVPHVAIGFIAFSLLYCARKKWRNIAYSLFLSLAFIYAEYKFHRWKQPRVEAYSENMRAWKDCYLQHRSVKACNELQNFKPYPHDPEHMKIQEKLERLEELNPSFRN